ncbi:hypothetical protein [Clostridium sp. UBA6640]|uniref:hypothetical protein n=1 Tax=Clostridium sp. UBA6640 TaxID=1946370 RepID=UPI0025BDD575|nr:hypothetical protein [Clostridium sp. UBA6640]
MLGCIYPDKAAQAITNIPLISNLANKIISHTSVIDCGENDSEKDGFEVYLLHSTN